MAEEVKKSNSNFEHAVIGLVVLFIIIQIVYTIPKFLQEKLGVDASYIAVMFNINPPINVDAPLGTRVINKNIATLFNEPAGSEIFKKARGASGSVVGGVVLREEKFWWQVRYNDGDVGWIHEGDIGINSTENQKVVKESSPHGTRILNNGEVWVYSEPGDGNIVATVDNKEKGFIYGGPVYIDGDRWWQVKYEDGPIGWVNEEGVEVDVNRNLKAVTSDTIIGVEVRNVEETDVWNSPWNGFLLGTQFKKAQGLLSDGPVLVSSDRWWFVDYKEGVDGWVKEIVLVKKFIITDNILYIKSLFTKISYSISLILFIAIVYIVINLRKENFRESKMFSALATLLDETKIKNPRWEKILRDVESDNPNDWKQAIMEADILLDEVVTRMSYHGDSLGEKLRTIERSDFLTLDKAWEAHKVRNAIAHEAVDYILTQREAKRVIELYREVFKEFFFV